MLVTNRQIVRGHDLRPAVARAVEGGVGLVHVRERDLDDVALGALIDKLRAVLPRATTLVVNGRPALARALGIGLHLPAAAPACTAGSEPAAPRPLGRSAHDEAEAVRARDEDVDYLLLGTIYPTRSKPGRAGAGADLVRAVVRRVPTLPVFAIGGVSVPRIPELLHAGAYGVAACRALLEAHDPRRVAQAMTLALSLAQR
jgi:thiamine-phosphate diphosphorylase